MQRIRRRVLGIVISHDEREIRCQCLLQNSPGVTSTVFRLKYICRK